LKWRKTVLERERKLWLSSVLVPSPSLILKLLRYMLLLVRNFLLIWARFVNSIQGRIWFRIWGLCDVMDPKIATGKLWFMVFLTHSYVFLSFLMIWSERNGKRKRKVFCVWFLLLDCYYNMLSSCMFLRFFILFGVFDSVNWKFFVKLGFVMCGCGYNDWPWKMCDLWQSIYRLS